MQIVSGYNLTYQTHLHNPITFTRFLPVYPVQYYVYNLMYTHVISNPDNSVGRDFDSHFTEKKTDFRAVILYHTCKQQSQ